MEANQDIRRNARGNGVPFWKIAKILGISEATMSRRLHEELSATEKEKFLSIIKDLSEAKTNG